jgi:hypothetical protein
MYDTRSWGRAVQQIKDWATGSLKAVRAHIPLTVGLIVVGGLLIGGYNVFQALDLDASDAGAVSSAVAAIAGALAAFAALGAARESRRTAKDATRALALATKPMPEIRMNIERSDSQPELCTMHIEIENLSVHPLRNGKVEWVLRDGQRGTQSLGEIRGRLKPFGGMFHRAEGVETLLASAAFDGGSAGVDRVTLDYWGNTREVGWRSTLAIEWEVVPGRWSEKDGIRIANTTRNRYDRSEIEI